MKHSFFFILLILSAILPADQYGAEKASKITVRLSDDNQTFRFAGEELVRYIGLMAQNKNAAEVEAFGLVSKEITGPILKVGLFSHFGISMPGLEDPQLDDAIYVNVTKSNGIIAGSNSRSVLFAVYRFLEENGCRWIRPRRDGDFVPNRSVNDLSGNVKELAFYRFRGNSNCGTFTIDDVLDRVAWSPKVGLNTFMQEFMLPRRNYNNYYQRPYPSLAAPQNLTDDEIRAYHELMIKEIKRRGLSYHAVGHGWTGAVAGAPESESDHNSRPDPDPDKIQYLALSKGERSLQRGPTLTDICHGNPDAQTRFAYCVADYARRHPEVDYLHVWLDDAPNNCCECEKCKGLFISDSYVRLLNRIDEELTRRNLATKIVFIIYHETLWKPLKEKFKHQERFTMLFAPISRDYTIPYSKNIPKEVDMSPYPFNQCKLPKGVDMNLALMKGWREIYQGPSFVYEYHQVWHHWTDFGYFDFARVMAEDIRCLKSLDLDGFVSCQVGRANFPHGFPMWLHAKMLWNPNQNFDTLAVNYFNAAFGPDGPKVLDYVKALSKNSVFTFNRPTSDQKEEYLRKFDAAKKQMTAFRPFIQEHLQIEPKAVRDSWKYLDLHSQIYPPLIDGLIARATLPTSDPKRRTAWQPMVDIIAQTEEETHPVLDLFWFYSRMGEAKKLTPSRSVSP